MVVALGLCGLDCRLGFPRGRETEADRVRTGPILVPRRGTDHAAVRSFLRRTERSIPLPVKGLVVCRRHRLGDLDGCAPAPGADAAPDGGGRMSAIDVSVVIVGMNTRQLIVNCLNALAAADWAGYTYEIIYVDNASKDDSVEVVRRDFPHVQVIANTANRHFCPAANQGSQAARGRLLLHLNNDTEVDADAMAPMIRFLDSEPRAAVAGCRLLNPDRSDQWSARRFPEWYNAILGRRSVLSRFAPESAPVRKYLFNPHFRFEPRVRISRMLVRINIHRGLKAAKTPA
ncbi:MAG: glycosyltransferase, partial [Acidobacteria bacterium]|nr:glycosyltransferase [Acidobacteriota bacterium]